MSVRARGDAALMVVLTVLWLPARIVEEGIHALAALPWAREINVRLLPRTGDAETVVLFRDDAPYWAVRTAYAAPEIVATLGGMVVIGWWAISGTAWWPQTALDFLLLSLVGAQWLAIAIPSAQDMDQSPEARDV